MSVTDPRIFETLVAQIRDYAIFLLSPEGTIQTWNIGAQLIKGYAPNEIVGRHFSVFYPREAIERDWPARELRAAAADGRFEDEGWRVRKDGSRFWANVVITALRHDDGRLIGFSKVTRDLTLRRANEEKIRQSEEQFRLLIEGLEEYALYMLDNEGRVSSWNGGAQRIYGYSPGEVIGRHFSWLCLPEDVKAGVPWQELAAARATGRTVDEGWRVRKSGERFWARVVITALQDEEGTARGFAKMTQDLTERRQLKQAEDTARRMNEFVAMLAHELRNPLAPILNAVETLERLPAPDKAQSSLLAVIGRQTRHLAHIVDDLIDVNRVTRGTLSIQKRPVDLAEVIRRSIEITAPAMESAGHKLEMELGDDPLNVSADLHRLTQVIANILNNASRYTPPGGQITIAARRLPDEILVSVTDTGRGVAPEDVDRIFNPFDQGGHFPPGNTGGLGIGLALARRIVELHGGTITVESGGVGKGSTFHVHLPRTLTSIEPEGELAHIQQRTSPLVRRRVLVVDDHVDAARMLQLLLQFEGHETRIAHDGPSALKAIAEFRPEFVFLDIGMPGMSGYEIARAVRASQGRRNVFLVALTGWGQPSDVRESKEAGFDLHMVKPLDTASVKRLLESPTPGTSVH